MLIINEIIILLFIIYIINNKKYSMYYIFFLKYTLKSNNNKFNSIVSYVQCCGFGNKLLGLISSIAYCISYGCNLKVKNWNSLWWYFAFPLQYDNKTYTYNRTFKRHFFGVKDVVDNPKTRNYLIRNGIIGIKSKKIILMVNHLAYRITDFFLKINNYIKNKINNNYIDGIDYGLHLRTGKADGKDYLFHYLKYDDIIDIIKYIKLINKSYIIFVSSDSIKAKYNLSKIFNNLMFINTSSCNSAYGLTLVNNSCAIEAITDYYILSKCKKLLLTKGSSFSLVSLFANKIGYSKRCLYKYFGKYQRYSDIFQS